MVMTDTEPVDQKVNVAINFNSIEILKVSFRNHEMILIGIFITRHFSPTRKKLKRAFFSSLTKIKVIIERNCCLENVWSLGKCQ